MRLQLFSNANWFDVVVLGVIILGIVRGRKHGMSEELLPLLQWLVIVILGAHTYESFGKALQNVSGLGLTLCNITVYLFEAIVVAWAFTAIKHSVGDKLLTADAFGRGEFYYGMVAAVLRYSAVLILALSLLNSIYVSDAERAATAKMQRDNFGSIEAPSLGGTQQYVFQRSFMGPLIKKYIGHLLIQPVVSGQAPKRETLGRQRQRLLDEATGGK